MKSQIKLFGPSIYEGIDALNDLLKNLKKRYQYSELISQIISGTELDVDLLTGRLILKGSEHIGEYDFVIEWIFPPNTEQILGLIRHLDEVLLSTGCRYTITTKR